MNCDERHGRCCGACWVVRGVASLLDRAAPAWRAWLLRCLDEDGPRGETTPITRDDTTPSVGSTSRRVAVGWSENAGSFLPNARPEVLLFAATIDAACTYVRGDTTAPPIRLADFVASDGARASAFDADLLLLAGHGTGPSLGLALPAQEALNFRTARFGGSLRWVVLDACWTFPPNGEGYAWRDAFSGIHLLLGHASAAVDSQSRGRIFAELLNEGESVSEAWARAVELTSDASHLWACMAPVTNQEALLGETFMSTAAIEVRYDAFDIIVKEA